MSRMHIHIAVADLAQNIRFYSTLFGTTPTVNKPDYARWELSDPAVNFAISSRGGAPGLDHIVQQAVERDRVRCGMRGGYDVSRYPVLNGR